MLEGNQQISDDGTITYAEVELPGEADQERFEEFSDSVLEIAPDIEGVRIEYGGQIFSDFDPPSSEMLGLSFAIVILILATGSVLAMGLPIGVALGGIGIGATFIMLVSNVMSMPDFAATLGVMIGLGVGIDYALFVVTRYREQLGGRPYGRGGRLDGDRHFRSRRRVRRCDRDHLTPRHAHDANGDGQRTRDRLGDRGHRDPPRVPDTASRTIGIRRRAHRGEPLARIVAACFVVVALIGLGLKIQPLLVGFPLALIVLVASTVFAPLRAKVPQRKAKPLRETYAYRWSRIVQARPWTITIASAALLLLLATPVLSMRLGFSDRGNDPEASSTRQAYDLLAEGFGPGSNGPLILVAQLDDDVDPGELVAATEAIAQAPGVQDVMGPIPNTALNPSADAATAALWAVQPTTAPQDEATTELVDTLRHELLPEVEPSGTEILVTGFVAVTVDFSEYLSARLPWFFAAVLGLSFILLMVVFRSLLVPLKAVIMNLLSIGAAYGVMGGGLPMGMGPGAARRRTGADRAVPAHGPVRHRVRSVHGLRGLPVVPHPRGVDAHRGFTHLGGGRPGGDRACDHRRRGHHGVRLRLLHARRRPGREAHGPGTGRGRAVGCDGRAHADGARHHGVAG
ncbi:MAG: MMPL family transporter [Microthrixaceae bacterium]|nr:MMPL family transporter [Microthrixaceae bacterium]